MIEDWTGSCDTKTDSMWNVQNWSDWIVSMSDNNSPGINEGFCRVSFFSILCSDKLFVNRVLVSIIWTPLIAGNSNNA